MCYDFEAKIVLYIQYSFLRFFPANTMISWTTNEDSHQQNPSLAYRFDVAMSGVMGVGNNITKWTNEEKVLATEKIKKYKEIRTFFFHSIIGIGLSLIMTKIKSF